VFLGFVTRAQDVHPYSKELVSDYYYPENKTIRENKVKFVIGKADYGGRPTQYVMAYDRLGRLIGEFDYEVEKFSRPYIYARREDTLFRYKYRDSDGPLYALDRFVYNAKGQITSYLECSNTYALYEEFYYTGSGLLEAKLSYYKGHPIGPLSENFSIDRSALKLTDVEYYAFKQMKNGNRLRIASHALGKPEWRPIDTTVYDSRGRIVRFNSFAKVGALGCPIGNNVNRIVEYHHTDSSLMTTAYTTSCNAILETGECALPSKGETEMKLVVKDKRGLKKAAYSVAADGERKLTSSITYLHY
jgi:hypothetical protein